MNQSEFLNLITRLLKKGDFLLGLFLKDRRIHDKILSDTIHFTLEEKKDFFDNFSIGRDLTFENFDSIERFFLKTLCFYTKNMGIKVPYGKIGLYFYYMEKVSLKRIAETFQTSYEDFFHDFILERERLSFCNTLSDFKESKPCVYSRNLQSYLYSMNPLDKISLFYENHLLNCYTCENILKDHESYERGVISYFNSIAENGISSTLKIKNWAESLSRPYQNETFIQKGYGKIKNWMSVES